jgi:hypothetical protein
LTSPTVDPTLDPTIVDPTLYHAGFSSQVFHRRFWQSDFGKACNNSVLTLRQSIPYMPYCLEDPQLVSLILASTSPYRRDLLERLRIPFFCIPPGVDESRFPDETPQEMAWRLATEKSRVISARYPQHVVIGSGG